MLVNKKLANIEEQCIGDVAYQCTVEVQDHEKQSSDQQEARSQRDNEKLKWSQEAID